MDKVYTTLVDTYEIGREGEWSDMPHYYEKKSGTLEDAKKAQEDLLRETVEVEMLDGQVCKVEVAVTVTIDGLTKFLDSDEAFMRADVRRTDSPSRFVQQHPGKPMVCAVDWENSRLIVSDNLADVEGEE